MRLTERKWLLVTPQLLTSDGTESGHVTVADTSLFRVKQKVKLRSLTQPLTEANKLEVKRILSETEMIIGESGRIDNIEDLTDFLLADLATIEAEEQSRPSIDPVNIDRAQYEEEPIMADRSILVDKYGRRIGSATDTNGDVRLKVDAALSVDNVTVDIVDPVLPTIANVNIPVADTELQYTLPPSTKRFTIRVRDGYALLKLSYEAGKSATEYITIPLGCHYASGDVDAPTGFTIYFQSNRANKVLEIESWSR